MLCKKLNYLHLMALVSSGSASAGGFVGGMAKFVLFSVGVLFCGAWPPRPTMTPAAMVSNYILGTHKIIKLSQKSLNMLKKRSY